MNSYVLSSVVPKAFKNRNPGLKSLHKFIYARVRIKTSNGCCKREWEWSGPLDLFTNNAPPPHSVECFDSGPSINDLACQLTVWTLTEKRTKMTDLRLKFVKFAEKPRFVVVFQNRFKMPVNYQFDVFFERFFAFLSHEFLAYSKMPVLPSRLK